MLSRDEVDRLIEARAGKDGADGGRMATLLEILYGTGLRVSELVTLPLAAVERDPTMLVVRGKGDKERLVPLSDPARLAIVSVAACPRGLARRGRDPRAILFPSRGRTGHLTRQRFAQLLKEAALAADIDPGARVAARACATPSPAICWRAAPICAACN